MYTNRRSQPLRLLLNFFFHRFNHSEPTYKSKHECSKLGIVNSLTAFETFQGCMNMWKGHFIFRGDLTEYRKQIPDCRQLVLFVQGIRATFFSCFFRNWIQCSASYQLYTVLRGWSSFSVKSIYYPSTQSCLFQACHANPSTWSASHESKATITRCDLSPRFFCIDATLLCEFERNKIWINELE